MTIEYECGDGWRNLIDTAIDQMFAVDRKIHIEQVKEKFGGLRIYYSPSSKEVDKIVDLAEEIASETCEFCGSGDARNQKVRGWWKTLCAKCVSIEKKLD